ncbi:MAG: hypothetical protein ACOCXG_03385 [Nanoarchaeota archaeon]
MNLEQHKKEFEKIVKKYNLGENQKLDEIISYILKTQKINSDEFAKLFAIEEKDAQVFLSFIEKGLEFKKRLN